MKVIVTRIGKLEAAGGRSRKRARAIAAGGGVSLVYTSQESGRDAQDEGFGLAVDIFRSGRELAGVDEVATVTRPAKSRDDLGTVYGPDGEAVGRVVWRDGGLYRTDEG